MSIVGVIVLSNVVPPSSTLIFTVSPESVKSIFRVKALYCASLLETVIVVSAETVNSFHSSHESTSITNIEAPLEALFNCKLTLSVGLLVNFSEKLTFPFASSTRGLSAVTSSPYSSTIKIPAV